MKKKVGKFNFKMKEVSLYATSGNSGSVDIPVAINVGIDGEWDETLAILLHEILEYAYIDNSSAYRLDPDYTGSLSGVSFFMTHEQFDQSVTQSAEFLVDAIPALAKVYNKYHEK